jgi:DHA1 family inner membrane transport protein
VDPDISPTRRRVALATLALGGFGIGLTEFVAMGLLPEIAQGLRPDAWQRSPSSAVADTGWVVTLYAAGVVVGAPTFAAFTARMSRSRLVAALLGLFVLASVASAAAPTFELELVARFVAGLPHGAYFGAAGLLAATLMGPGSTARGYAVVLSGLTAANVVGIPLVTALGQATSWRVAYLAIAAVFALGLVAVVAAVPAVPAVRTASPRAELRALAAPQVWLVAGTLAVGFGGFFAVYTYLSPVTTDVTGLGSGAVPWVLATAGLGMTTGIVLGGRAADRDVRRASAGGFVAIAASIGLFCAVARSPVGLFAATFLVGASCMFVAPAMQALLVRAAPEAQLMGAAVNQSASNVANSLGAALGGLSVGAGLGYLSAAVVGLVLALAGVALVLTVVRTRHPDARPARRETDRLVGS